MRLFENHERLVPAALEEVEDGALKAFMDILRILPWVSTWQPVRIMFKMVERLSFAVDLEPVELSCGSHGDHEFYRKDDSEQ